MTVHITRRAFDYHGVTVLGFEYRHADRAVFVADHAPNNSRHFLDDLAVQLRVSVDDIKSAIFKQRGNKK